MRMTRKKIVIVALAISLCVSGCSKDKGLNGFTVIFAVVIPIVVLLPFVMLSKPFASINLKIQDAFPDREVRKLALAAEKGDLDSMAKLVAAGTDVNATGKNGFTVLGWAVYKKQLASVTWLLEHGADVNQTWGDQEQIVPCSAIHMAVAGSEEFGTEFLETALRTGKGNPNLVCRKARKSRPADYAIRREREKAFELLARHGLEVNYRSGSGNHPLAISATYAANFKLVLYLITNGAPYTSPYKNSREDLHNYIQTLYLSTTDVEFTKAMQTPENTMFFWRCVTYLEQRGYRFTINPEIQRPDVLDDTPIEYPKPIDAKDDETIPQQKTPATSHQSLYVAPLRSAA